jgi:hypothetical protein
VRDAVAHSDGSISLTSVRVIESTLIDLSSRLATRARVPAGLMLSHDGCFPIVTVPMALGGLALRSMTWTLSSVGHSGSAGSCQFRTHAAQQLAPIRSFHRASRPSANLRDGQL